MKILILSSAFHPHIYGGGEVAAYNMACLLVARGHEVHVATLKEKEEDSLDGVRQLEGFFLHRVVIPRSYTLFGRTSQKSHFQKIFWYLQDFFDSRNNIVIRRLLNRVKPDQVDIHNIMGFGYNVLPEIGKVGIPVKMFLHGLDLACFHASMFKNGMNCETPCGVCRVVGFLRQMNLAKIKHVAFIAPSQAPFDRLKSFVPQLAASPKAVIRNVSDPLPDLSPYQPLTQLRLAYAGRLDPVKGIDFLLDVLEPLAQHFDFRLDIYGTGNLEELLRARYAKKKWAVFHGFVPRDQVAEALAQADLFCMPSLWNEIYGLVTAQALRSGTPVIGSNIGGTSYLVRDGVTGVLVEPGNTEAWRGAFSSLLGSRDQLACLRQGAEAYKEEFSDDAIATQYENFSASII